MTAARSDDRHPYFRLPVLRSRFSVPLLSLFSLAVVLPGRLLPLAVRREQASGRCAQSRCRCGRGEPSPGAYAGVNEPIQVRVCVRLSCVRASVCACVACMHVYVRVYVRASSYRIGSVMQTASTARSSASTAIRSASRTAWKAACSRYARGTHAVLTWYSRGTHAALRAVL